MWFLTAVLGIVVLYIFYWLTKSNRNYWEKQGVVCFDSAPFIGLIKYLLFSKKGLGEIFSDLYKVYEKEKYVGFFQFLNPAIMIRDPELVNQIFIKDFSHFEDRAPRIEGPKDLFCESFSNYTGDYWRTARHKLTPTFTSGKLKMMFGAIKECSDEVAVYLNDKTDEDIDTRLMVSKYVLNVIGNIAFGLKIDTLNKKDERSKEFLKHANTFFKPSYSLVIKFMLTTSFPKLRKLLRFKLVDEGVETFFIQLTKDVIKYREETNTKRNDFLQLMLDLKKQEEHSLHQTIRDNDISINDNDKQESDDWEIMADMKNTTHEIKQSNLELFTDHFIASQSFVFISGGSESVAASVAFVAFELAQNQELQKKVQREISDVLSGQELNYESVKKLTYMEQFINETFRIHPLVPIFGRVCTKDYKIPGTEVIIKKGTAIIIPASGLHKDPQYFPDPEKFDPDRFQDMGAIPKGVFFPFGDGPRMCIAMRLAMLEMKVLLATLLSKYTITLSEKTKVPLKIQKNSFLVFVEGGIWVKFHKRQT